MENQRIFKPYFETGFLINVIEHEQMLNTDNNIAVNLCNSCNLRVSSFIRQPSEPKMRIIDDFVSVGRTKESDDSISVIHALLQKTKLYRLYCYFSDIYSYSAFGVVCNGINDDMNPMR